MHGRMADCSLGWTGSKAQKPEQAMTQCYMASFDDPTASAPKHGADVHQSLPKK
eukprot:CAMPEP_0181471258 /NCGR_PEP_ID=MMETSP1110-20121109/38980_1 /TAXON_ID=174948 /ORGANISM="Symbiodinium sp., Strain CCMP421" /LENGTH=53 /DNA_ID=CAMNT_0023596267 /DNA_START=165 /DNA_END=327 /DNA_ORIENTATION=+